MANLQAPSAWFRCREDTPSHGISYQRDVTRREWALGAETRNVRVGASQDLTVTT